MTLPRPRRPAINRTPEAKRPNSHRIHADSKTSLPRSIKETQDSQSWFIEGSRHVSVLPCRSVASASDHIRSCVLKAKLNGNIKVNELRSDGGGEFISNDLQLWLRSQGITFSPSAARTPEQNGVSERHIQSIMAIVRSTLKQARLTSGHWEHAALAAACVLNRTNHKSIPTGTTPHEIFTGPKPNLANLVPFGCVAWHPSTRSWRKGG